MLIELRNGPVVHAVAIALGCELENRGHRLSVSDDGKLLVTDGARLTADDRQRILAHKRHLVACVQYQATEVP